MSDRRVLLGYSGLDGSREFKQAHFPGLDPAEARLFQGLDAAAALVVDDRVVAAVQQERYSGLKFDHAFPVDAIRSCLAIAGLSITDVDEVRHNFDYSLAETFLQSSELSRSRFATVYAPSLQTGLLHRHFPELSGRSEVRAVSHHRAHALTAAVPSGFDEALVVVLDGMGELHAVTVHAWRNGQLTRLAALDFRSSLGLFYALLTLHLGCWPNSDEYKVMALAASGDPDRFAGSMQRALVLRDQGRFQVPLLELNRDAPSKETFSASRQWLSHSGCPGRSSDSNLLQVHLDLASAAQRRLEQALLHLVAHWVDRTGLRRVALAGGVALNCVAIGKLAASGVVDGIYVQPAAGDEGTAIGAALSAADLVVTATEYPPLTFLGPDVDEDQVPVNQPYFTAAVSEPIAEIIAARLLSQGLIVGWAQDRLEFGPRALGNRSIFADPRRREMRDRVNAAVKFREDFRPLAPAVKADCASRYFHIPPGTNMRHMTVAVPVNTHRASDITAVVHDDCTARVQEVHAAEHPRFWRILHEFERITGIGVLMNTSLNVKGQPTARSASEAYRTFDTSGLDVVFIGDRVYAKDEVVSTVRAVLAELTSQSAA